MEKILKFAIKGGMEKEEMIKKIECCVGFFNNDVNCHGGECKEHFEKYIDSLYKTSVQKELEDNCYKKIEKKSQAIEEIKGNLLEQFRLEFDDIKAVEMPVNQKNEALAVLMTDIEKAFNIPMINDENWNSKNKDIVELYREISEARDI